MPIGSSRFALNLPTVNVRNKPIACDYSTRPFCGMGIKANLICLWRVDSFEPDFNLANRYRIAVDDACDARDSIGCKRIASEH